jgi:hypothetical protein
MKALVEGEINLDFSKRPAIFEEIVESPWSFIEDGPLLIEMPKAPEETRTP